MNVALSDLGVGLEVVQTAMYLQISDKLEQALARQQLIWDRFDEMIAERQGIVDPPRTVLESIAPRSLTPGTRGSLLKLPADYFPAVAVMCDRVAPTPEAALISSSPFPFASQVYVEVVVRSDPFLPDDPEAEFEQEGVVDRRIKRTSSAVVECVMGDPTLGAAIPRVLPPRIVQTDSFLIQGTKPDDLGRVRTFSLARIDWVGELYAGFAEATSIASLSLPG